ncbi:MAG: lysylphosphatidylglycerol synthase domain-containing protein, partial [Alphaproteobacteria bacterium]|nr:lysylphosphatidylglycerol synthase domain-containing protein [Alphaproteobacteria bacterium]
GWRGIFAVSAFHIIPLAVSSFGWQILVPGKKRPGLAEFTYFMWIRAAINDFLPVARIGGEVASVRLLITHGMRRNVAIAITIGELTLSTASLLLFVALGVLLFALRVSNKDALMQMLWGLLLSLPLLAVLVAIQKIGLFGILSRLFRTLFRDKWTSFAGSAAQLDKTVTSIYRRKNRALACAFWSFLSWGLGSFEIWIALRFLGHPLPLAESVMIEALIQGSVSAAFAVPGALGVQEAGFVLFGGMLGLPHDCAVALSLIRRCRDIIYNTPALIVWQAREAKRLLKL